MTDRRWIQSRGWQCWGWRDTQAQTPRWSRALHLSLSLLSSKSGLFCLLWPSELGHPEVEVLKHKFTQRHMHPEVSQLEGTGQNRESLNHVSKSPEILLKMLNPGSIPAYFTLTLWDTGSLGSYSNTSSKLRTTSAEGEVFIHLLSTRWSQDQNVPSLEGLFLLSSLILISHKASLLS